MRFLLAMLVACVSTGCVDRSAAGVYVGRREVAPGPSHIVGPLSRVRLELRPDGTFSLENTSLTFSGNWQADGSIITLQIKESLGKRVTYRPAPTLEKHPEGWLFKDPGGADSAPVVLRREGK